MSDLFETRQKVEEGANWRGDITISVDGDTQTLSCRQLRDPEFWEVMSDIDTDELEDLQGDLPEDKMSELRDLREKDEGELDEAEQERLESLQDEIEEEDIDLFDTISRETYAGINTAAIYGTEPDQSDIQYALAEHADEINEKYGGTSSEEARQWVNDHVIKPMFERSTNFVSFSVGIKVLTETIGDTKN
jgi:hypothetical protein